LNELTPIAPPAQLEGIGRLTIYAWRFRYPGAPYSPDREEAERAMQMASQLLDAIASRLNTEFSQV